MTLWLYVSKDKYELPLAVADSATQLARMLGVKTNTVYSAMSIAKRNGYKCRYKKVSVDEKECE